MIRDEKYSVDKKKLMAWLTELRSKLPRCRECTIRRRK